MIVPCKSSPQFIMNVIMKQEGAMATAVKITTVGNSAGIVLPKELLSHLNVQKGDSLYVTKTPEGIQLIPYNAEFAAQMDVAERVIGKYRDALRRLAE
jgi:putative addiction module antidote